jgi:polysaccharide export outer membrane protein
MKRALCCAGAAMLFAVLAARADNPEPDPDPAAYRIGVEDVLDIAVRNDDHLQKVMPVRPDGKISMPLINDVAAAGLTPMQLRDTLRDKYSAYIQNPDVSVIVREIHSFKVSILGNVKMPGRYELKGKSTVLDAIAMAQGLTDFAARRKIVLLRDTQRIRFDYDAAVKDGGERNITLKTGDIIIVP